MIGRIEKLFDYSLVNDFVTSPPTGISFYLAKFNISFAILLFIYLIFRRNINWRHIVFLVVLAIPLLLSDELLYRIFAPSTKNPQTPHYVMLLFFTFTLIGLAIRKKTRSLARIFGSIIGIAILCAFTLIHSATINIKLQEQTNRIISSHISVFEATIERDDNQTFFHYCAIEKIHCIDSVPNSEQRKALKPLLRDRYDDIFEVIDGNGKSIVEYSLESDLGAYIFMYAKINGVIRLLIDQNNIEQVHLSSLIVMYSWFAIVTSAWLYGGLFLYRVHTHRFVRRHR